MTVIIIVILAIFVLSIIIISLSASNKSGKRNSYSTSADDFDHSWRTNNADGSFTIYDKKGAVTVVKTYEGGERYINGHKCSCADDMDRWYVKKGYCEGIERRLVQIEQDLERLNTEGGEKLLEEWNRRYEEYRQLCISHGFWNWIIEDRTTFIPTQFQLKKEKIKKEELESLFEKWKDRMLENQVLLDYLRTCPRKHAIKKDMLKDLSDGDPEKRKIINTIYRRLIKAKVIAEKENQEGKIETRIVNHRKNKDITIKPLPPSRFDPKVFCNVGKKDIYKVEYTVDKPNDLDYEKKTCYFVSKSSGDIYRTSLEKCTCPIYHKGNACKHMVALALKLGYLDKETVLRK